ncbi:MAG: glycosyltransferase family 2 protein [Blastocatellia bacterium]
MRDLVSILIPCYNSAPWIGRAIETALAQTWPNKEVVVLDDGSTDGSFEVIQQYASQIRVARQANRGQNASRNRLTELSRGAWLAYLDADDEMSPDCVEKKMEFAQEADAVYGTVEVACFLDLEKTRYTVQTAETFADPIVAAFWWSYPNTSSFMFRKAAVLDVGGWNAEIKNCTDYDLYFKLLIKNKRFRAAPESQTLYRQWSTSQAVYQDPQRKLRTRLQVLWHAAHEFDAAGLLNNERREAFEQAAFGVVRMLYNFNPVVAHREYAKLIGWNPRFHPTAKTFSPTYRSVYKLAGFAVTEHLAYLARRLNPVTKPLPGVDPKTGLPYT